MIFLRVRWLVAVAFSAALFGCVSQRSESNSATSFEEFRLTSPAERLVYQRGLDDAALVPVAGGGARPGAAVEVRLMAVDSPAAKGGWKRIGVVRADGSFDNRVRVKRGWYRLNARTRAAAGQTVTATVHRVGVGEVFVVVGHSVAHGGRTNLAGATDDRVNTIAWPVDSSATRKEYERTGEPRYLPPVVGAHFTNGVVPAPFGNGTYFWAQFAEYVAKAQDVPVLILNAAFGGTSLEHWAKSARGEQFEHSFVKSEIRMPYVNLRNALLSYARLTGVRAILADQGQNDWPEPDAGKVFTNYAAWIHQARNDLGCPELAVVVNRQTPPGNKAQIRRAQERVIREHPHCFTGPDYDTLAKADRYDGIHLSEAGMEKAAMLWAEALNPGFFQQSTPYQPR